MLNETKATVAERVIKTIKSKIYGYFTFKQIYRYVDELQNFVDSYNNTYHRTIKMKWISRMKPESGGTCIGLNI